MWYFATDRKTTTVHIFKGSKMNLSNSIVYVGYVNGEMDKENAIKCFKTHYTNPTEEFVNVFPCDSEVLDFIISNI